MAILENPTSFFSGGGTIGGNVTVEGDLTIEGASNFQGGLNLQDNDLLTFGDDDDFSLRFDPAIGASGALVSQDEINNNDFIEQRVGGDVIIQQNLTVNGQTTTVDDIVTTDVVVEDSGGTDQFVFDGDASTPFFDINQNEVRNLGKLETTGNNPTPLTIDGPDVNAANETITTDVTGRDSGGNNITYNRVFAEVIDATDGTEDARRVWSLPNAGTVGRRMELENNGDLDIEGTLTEGATL